MIDFSTYQFRASQCHFLMVGTIGLTDKQKAEMSDLIARKKASERGDLDEKGKPVKPLTPNMEDKLKELTLANEDKSLPKTMQNELRKIHRAEMFNRNFLFTNKYVQEEEAITLFQDIEIKYWEKKHTSQKTLKD